MIRKTNALMIRRCSASSCHDPADHRIGGLRTELVLTAAA
jgi:hypothetical protein